MTDTDFWWNALLAAPFYVPIIMFGMWLGERMKNTVTTAERGGDG